MLSMGRLPTRVPIHILHRAIKEAFDSQFLEVATQIIIGNSKGAGGEFEKGNDILQNQCGEHCVLHNDTFFVKCAHLQMARQAEQKPFYTSKLWWCGAVLLGLGELGNFTAYGFAPIAVVAPLGCVSIIGSAFISVLFLKKTMRAADILGGTLAIVGTYLLVTFAPNVPQELTARRVQNDLVSWPFLAYVILEIIIFCILLYFYKVKAAKHIVVLLMMVALLGKNILFTLMFLFLNQAMHLYEARTVVPINFVFCTTSAIISGVIFYQEFQSAAFLSVFMFLLGCLLSFLSVFAIAVNKKEEHLQVPYIDCGCIPGK
ncbi:hypothetical protein ASZ78_015070 [Callipepla squamata]|uniref:NIPA-like protein 2 n=1 Tax=Callipepla squamata TaxID=9009 RepID=A0A226N3Z0_CALSU|nr:hypothetical protein ASZ78_015070 [Callipepla squamata]